MSGKKLEFVRLLVSGEENSRGWLYGEDEGKTIVPFSCPLLACHMPVFATKSTERKVNLHSLTDSFSFCNSHETCAKYHHWLKLVRLYKSMQWQNEHT